MSVRKLLTSIFEGDSIIIDAVYLMKEGKCMKKIISIICVLCIAFGTMITAFATESETANFIEVDDFKAEITADNFVSITGYSGSDEKITIPATLAEYTVKSVASYAFLNNVNLREVKISDGIEEICDYAFSGCRGLDSVVIPNSVKVIGEGAFFYCPRLQSVSLSPEIEHIGEKAFGYNSRSFDVETMTYSYNVFKAFVIYASQGTAGYTYALENNIKTNESIDAPYYDIFDCWFEIPLEWYGTEAVYCKLWELGDGGLVITDGISKESEMYLSANHSAYFSSYLESRINIGTIYGVVFINDKGEETYPAIFRYPNGSYFYTNSIYAIGDMTSVPSLVGSWTSSKTEEYEQAFGFKNGYKEVNPDEYEPPVVEEDNSWMEYVSDDIDLYGDVNLDGEINIRDATLIRKHLAMFDGLAISAKSEILMEVYPGAGQNIRCATQVQKYCANLPTDSQVGKPAVSKVYLMRYSDWTEDISFEFAGVDTDDTGSGVTVEDESTENMLYFYAPIYAYELTLVCGDARSERFVLNIKDNSIDGEYNYILIPNYVSPDTGLLDFNEVERH